MQITTFPSSPERTRVIAQVSSPERAQAMRETAHLVDNVVVNVLDPSVTEEADIYANASAREELVIHARTLLYNGISRNPRTPEQIKKEVVEPALKAGKALVLLYAKQQDLGNFWRQVDEVLG